MDGLHAPRQRMNERKRTNERTNERTHARTQAHINKRAHPCKYAYTRKNIRHTRVHIIPTTKSNLKCVIGYQASRCLQCTCRQDTAETIVRKPVIRESRLHYTVPSVPKLVRNISGIPIGIAIQVWHNSVSPTPYNCRPTPQRIAMPATWNRIL